MMMTEAGLKRADAVTANTSTDFPPLKRPRLDGPPTHESFDTSNPPFGDNSNDISYRLSLAYRLSLVKSLPVIKHDHHEQFQRYAKLVLANYKQNTGLDYEFTGRRSIAPFPISRGYKGSHLNFYARLKGSESNPQELFYAELDLREDKVHNSCILPPEEPAGEFIIHPKDYKCKECGDGTFMGSDCFFD